DAVVVAAADQSVAGRQTNSTEDLDAVAFGAVAGGARPATQVELVGPDYLAFGVVFADAAVPLMADKVGAGVELARQAGVAMRFGMIDVERDFADDLPLPVNLDDAAVARLGDHDRAVRQRLKGVDLDAALGLDRLGRVFPDGLAVGGDFLDAGGAGMEKQ